MILIITSQYWGKLKEKSCFSERKREKERRVEEIGTRWEQEKRKNKKKWHRGKGFQALPTITFHIITLYSFFFSKCVSWLPFYNDVNYFQFSM